MARDQGLLAARGRASLSLLVATSMTLLFAASVLCMAVLYAQGATDVGLRTLLLAAAHEQRAVQVSVGGLNAQPDEAAAQLAATAWPVPTTTGEVALTRQFPMDLAGTAVRTRLLVGEDLGGLVHVLEGDWTTSQDGANGLVLAAPLAAATQFRLVLGSPVVIDVGSEQITGVVGALVEPIDSTDPAWAGQGPLVSGQTGWQIPLLVLHAPEALLDRATLYWTIQPDFAALTAAQLPTLLAAVRGLEAAAGGVRGMRITSGVPDLLVGALRPMAVARSLVYFPAVLLAAAAAVVLTVGARLLVAARSADLWLLRARGLSSGQVWALVLGEAGLVATPTLTLAPLLAAVVTGQYHALRSPMVWTLAGMVAVGGLVVLVQATLGASRLAKPRDVVRLVAEGLLGCAAILGGLQLLRSTGWGATGLSATGSDGLVVADPLLVLAPAAMLVAGAVVTARLARLLARGVSRYLVRGAAPALGLWQVSRGGTGIVTTALVLAIAVGGLAAGYTASWRTSTRDQARLAVGADLQVTVSGGDADGAQVALGRLPGVAAVLPVISAPTTAQGRVFWLVALDAARTPGVVDLRGAAASFADLRTDGAEFVDGGAGRVDGVPGPPVADSGTGPQGAAGEISVPALTTVSGPAPGFVMLQGRRVWLNVVGQLAELPGQGFGNSDRLGFVVDLPTLQERFLTVGAHAPQPTSFWLATTSDTAAKEIEQAGLGVVTADRVALEHELATNPFGVIVATALWIALGGAGFFAVLALVLEAGSAVRARREEFAVLGALGATRDQVFGALAVERGWHFGWATVTGLCLGAGLTWLLVPRFLLDVRGLAPQPLVQVHLGWAQSAALVLSLAVVASMTVAVVARTAQARTLPSREPIPARP